MNNTGKLPNNTAPQNLNQDIPNEPKKLRTNSAKNSNQVELMQM